MASHRGFMEDYEYEEEDKGLMVREGFHMLTQGVEMTHYEVHKGFRRTYSNEMKMVWLNPDSLRLCVTKLRPSIAQNKVYPGVYLRDVVDVVGGKHTFGFATQPEPPEFDETCLNIIASERTLCLQLPSEFSRNWFMERLRLLCDDILTTNEKSLRDSIKWTKMSNRVVVKDAQSYKDIAESTQDFLEKGVEVLCHSPSGSINESTLYYNQHDQRLEIKQKGGFFCFVSPVRGININDIYALRPGTHSFGFVQTKSQNGKQENCVSIIGSECSIDIELSSQRARDLLMHKVKVFADYTYLSNRDAV